MTVNSNPAIVRLSQLALRFRNMSPRRPPTPRAKLKATPTNAPTSVSATAFRRPVITNTTTRKSRTNESMNETIAARVTQISWGLSRGSVLSKTVDERRRRSCGRNDGRGLPFSKSEESVLDWEVGLSLPNKDSRSSAVLFSRQARDFNF